MNYTPPEISITRWEWIWRSAVHQKARDFVWSTSIPSGQYSMAMNSEIKSYCRRVNKIRHDDIQRNAAEQQFWVKFLQEVFLVRPRTTRPWWIQFGAYSERSLCWQTSFRVVGVKYLKRRPDSSDAETSSDLDAGNQEVITIDGRKMPSRVQSVHHNLVHVLSSVFVCISCFGGQCHSDLKGVFQRRPLAHNGRKSDDGPLSETLLRLKRWCCCSQGRFAPIFALSMIITRYTCNSGSQWRKSPGTV